MNLRKWKVRIANIRKKSTLDLPLEHHLCHLHSEVSECFEELRSGQSPRYTYYGKGDKPEGFPSELADVVMTALLIADVCGIDIEAAMEEKIRHKETHG